MKRPALKNFRRIVVKVGSSSLTTAAGLIDDVRIYNRALSSAELKADMDTPASTIARTVRS